MLKRIITLSLVIALTVGGYRMFASPGTESAGASRASDEEHDGGHAEPPSDSTEISKEAAEGAGIRTAAAGPATVRETVALTGRITLNQNTTARIEARFPGIVRKVTKGQGEAVDSGEVLAEVESNDSLRAYPVKSPIDGVILVRNTNVGDVAGDAPLFVIADVSEVWAEFHVFPRDVEKVAAGQVIRVVSVDGRRGAEAPIALVLPLAEASSQTIVARATLPNPEGVWRSGMTVRGEVEVAEEAVPVAVRTPSIQRMEGKSVVFVADGDRYSMRPIKTGASDPTWTEILDGLRPGEVYVSENSFLIKADIGKAGAADED